MSLKGWESLEPTQSIQIQCIPQTMVSTKFFSQFFITKSQSATSILPLKKSAQNKCEECRVEKMEKKEKFRLMNDFFLFAWLYWAVSFFSSTWTYLGSLILIIFFSSLFSTLNYWWKKAEPKKKMKENSVVVEKIQRFRFLLSCVYIFFFFSFC